MTDYLFIETRHPSESRDVEHTFELAAKLVALGNRVTTYLAQNGVLAARAGAGCPAFSAAKNAGVTLLADDFSCRERGIAPDELDAGISPAPIEVVVDRLVAGARAIWK